MLRLVQTGLLLLKALKLSCKASCLALEPHQIPQTGIVRPSGLDLRAKLFATICLLFLFLHDLSANQYTSGCISEVI